MLPTTRIGGRGGVFVPVPLDPSGKAGPTAWTARGPRWRRSSHGLYVPTSARRTVEQRIVEAASLLPEHGGVTGWAGLRWQGGRWFDGTGPSRRARPVWLATAGDDIRGQPGVSVSAERLDPRDLHRLDGVRVTSAVRSVFFEMRYSDRLWDAVVALDMAAFDDLVSIDQVSGYAREHRGWTGVPRCREAILLADENSWSPQETRTRLVWVTVAHLPEPLCNRPVFDPSGRHIGTPDLLDVDRGVVVEYDGSDHLKTAQRRKDIGREERFRNAGLEYLTVMAGHLLEPLTLAGRMHDARDRAQRSTARRGWTVEPPSWWTCTHTVELRRAAGSRFRSKGAA